MNTKICNRCKQEKSLDAFNKDKWKKDGHATICKECRNKEFHEKYDNNPEFREKFKKHVTDYYRKNSEYVKERVKKYAEENHEKVLEKARIYWHTKTDKKAYNAKRQAKRKFLYKTDPEFRKRRKAECQHSARIRKMKLKQIEGSYTLKEWNDLCEKYNYRCACCGKKTKLTADHIIPISKGGTNYIINIQPLCMHCNCSKNDKAIYYPQNQNKVVAELSLPLPLLSPIKD